jgi:hypothetical protein
VKLLAASWTRMPAAPPDGAAGNDPMNGQPRHATMENTRHEAGISHDELWMHYFALTGDAAPLEVEAYLQGLMPLPAAQQDILGQALRECVQESHPDRPGGQDAHDESPS